jgi:hypothetical protein
MNNSVLVTSTEGGPGNTSNASITVVAPPVIIKAFGAASIPLSGTTSLTFTIQNNNTTTTLTGVGFTDALPAGLVVATPNGLTGSCGGGTITATAGSGSVSLTGASLAASTSCTFAVNVTGTTGGTKNNTTGNVTSANGGTGGTASASVAVVAPPSIAKAFGSASIVVGNNTTLSFTITNPAANTVALTGVAFTDTFPGALIVATPNGLSSTCGGTATATAGSNSVSLTGATVAAASSCNVTVTVTGPLGSYANTSGAVSSTNGGTGNTASASLLIIPPGPVLILTPIQTTVTAFQGDTATFAINMTATLPLGAVTFSCSGQPAGTNCQFSAPPPTPGSGNVLMTIQTFRGHHDSVALMPGGSGTNMLYAALLLPLLGLIVMSLSKQNRNKTKLRFAMACGGLVLALAMVGCGGRHDDGTTPGVYHITVTATTATAQATSNVTLNLLHR